MKKIVLLLCAVVLLVAVIGCGGSNTPQETQRPIHTPPDMLAQPSSPQEDFEFLIDDEFGEVIILNYIGSDTHIVVPAYVETPEGEKFPIVGIQSRAFANKYIASIVFPSNIERLGNIFRKDTSNFFEVDPGAPSLRYLIFEGDAPELWSPHLFIPSTFLTVRHGLFKISLSITMPMHKALTNLHGT